MSNIQSDRYKQNVVKEYKKFYTTIDQNVDFDNVKEFAGKKHAIILAPAIELRHYINILQAKKAFSELKYDSIDIISPEHSEIQPSTTTMNSSIINQYSAKTKSIENALYNIQKNSSYNDLFTLYVTGHGNKKNTLKGSGVIRLKDTIISSEDLNIEVKRILPENYKIIIADQCYGFNFMYDFIDSQKTIGISASTIDSKSVEETFPEEFFSALIKTGNIKTAFYHAYKNDINVGLDNHDPRFVEINENGEKIVVPIISGGEPKWPSDFEKISKEYDENEYETYKATEYAKKYHEKRMDIDTELSREISKEIFGESDKICDEKILTKQAAQLKSISDSQFRKATKEYQKHMM